MWASIQRPVQGAAAGPWQMVSKVRKSRSVLGSPLPTVGQNGATAPVAATAHYLKLTSRLWFVQLIFRSNDRVAFWGSDVISKLVSNVILFYFIFLRSRISGFWMGFFGKDFWTFSSNWDFVSRIQSWETRSFPGSCWPLLQALWLTPSLSGYTVILSLIWESPDRQRRKKNHHLSHLHSSLLHFELFIHEWCFLGRV